MRKLLGWAAVVGGSLAAMAAALLLLGPALGFFPWSPTGPGARTTSSVDLPRLVVAQSGAAAALTEAWTLGALAPVAGEAPATGPAAGGATAGIGDDSRRAVRLPTGTLVTVPDAGGALEPAPATPSAPVAPAPAVAAPVTDQQPATPEPVTVADTTPAATNEPAAATQRPGNSSNNFSASSSNRDDSKTDEQPATSSPEEASRGRGNAYGRTVEKAAPKQKVRISRGRSEEAPPAVPATIEEPAAPAAPEQQQDNDDHDHGRGHDHQGNNRPGRGGKD